MASTLSAGASAPMAEALMSTAVRALAAVDRDLSPVCLRRDG